MAVADKLTQIANNVPLVYDAGYEKGKAEGGGGDDISKYISGFQSLFRNAVFPQGYELTLTIYQKMVIAEIDNFTFNSKNLKSFTLIKAVDDSRTLSANNFCRAVTSLETVDLTRFNYQLNSLQWAFLGCSNLKYVYGALDFSKLTSATIWLNGASKLKHMEFVPNTIKITLSFEWCPNLSANTIQSIIDGLITITDGVARTITFHADVKGKLTDEQKATITTVKGWTLA